MILITTESVKIFSELQKLGQLPSFQVQACTTWLGAGTKTAPSHHVSACQTVTLTTRKKKLKKKKQNPKTQAAINIWMCHVTGSGLLDQMTSRGTAILVQVKDLPGSVVCLQPWQLLWNDSSTNSRTLSYLDLQWIYSFTSLK